MSGQTGLLDILSDGPDFHYRRYRLFLMFPGLDPLLQTAGIILAVPMLGIYAVIGQHYELGAFCAAALVPTTVVSFVTITTVAWRLTHYYSVYCRAGGQVEPMLTDSSDTRARPAFA